jgi:hypothetical protein
VGQVQLHGECYIDDYNSAHTSLVRGSQYTSSTVFKDITGNVYWRRSYTTNAPVIYWPTSTSGVTLTATPFELLKTSGPETAGIPAASGSDVSVSMPMIRSAVVTASAAPGTRFASWPGTPLWATYTTCR